MKSVTPLEETPVQLLDQLPLLESSIGYGELGLNGRLGYEDKLVTVQGHPFRNSLSAHPPSRLVFELGGRFSSFHCRAAINDDVRPGRSHADFCVLADGRQVAAALRVRAGEPARPMQADISGTRQLELLTRTGRWEYSHAVWLDPAVGNASVVNQESSLVDCLGRVEISVPALPPRARRCIATVASPGFESHLDDMLGSLTANGGCPDALLAVFAVGESRLCRRVADKYQAVLIGCRPHARVNATVKAAMYSAARVIDADYFLCLDADMLVLGDLNPVFAALQALPSNSILACREGNGRGWHGFRDLNHALCSVYGGRAPDLKRILGSANGEGSYRLVVNDGLFAAGRHALLELDECIRSMPQAVAWTDQRRDIWWRNQFVFNLALARMECGVELNPLYNIQLNSHDVEFRKERGRISAFWMGQAARVLHFNGLGRHKNPDWRKLYAGVPDPLAGRGGGDGYSEFLSALRAWVGRLGLAGLAWSFYGDSDARSARVADPDVLPLLALLHYLIRSNGCVQVLETGTARGVSAACLASAVAHRQGARVVTFDPARFPEREDLWQSLPEPMSSCIEARTVDSLQGMAEALQAGESYQAALLDSLHEEGHVWEEFQLACRLVCPGGLILIHDALLEHGSVRRALERIEDAGYGVVRLWAAEEGEAEGDRLGLAVIENHG